MATVTETATIPAPPRDVWAVIADFDRYDEWLTLHQGFPQGPPERIEEGAVFTQKIMAMGMAVEVTWTIGAVEEPQRIQLAGHGPMGVQLRTEYRLAAVGEATELTLETEFSGSALGPMAGTVAKQVGKANEESLHNLAKLF